MSNDDFRDDLTLEDLAQINFLNGTLVEYETRAGFRKEFSRGTITQTDIDNSTLIIATDNDKANLYWRVTYCQGK